MNFLTRTLSQLLVCWLVSLPTPTFAVSFYGTSYIHVPISHAYSQTDIELRFKTPRPHGLLMLLAGQNDFLLIQLRSGTIQVRMNLGLEETILKVKDTRLDDLEWHKVKVKTNNGEMVLEVDDKYTEHKPIKGEFSILNIDSGVFLGGADAETDALFGDELKKFRGCLSNVTINEQDIVSVASGLTDPGKVVEVSWGDDEIFDASRDDPISYLSDTSFLSFSHFNLQEDKTVTFQVRTATSTALLLFNTKVNGDRQDYIALQIIDGLLRFSASKNGEIIAINSTVKIDDDQWHLVDLALVVTGLELVVDGHGRTVEFTDHSSGVILGRHVYIGGINHRMRTLVNRLPGLDSVQGNNIMKGSIEGCIKDIVINSRVFSIRDIHVSRLIGAGCPTAEEQLCPEEGCQSQLDTGDTQCRTGENCRSADLSEVTPISDSSQDELQLLSVRPLEVQEGGNAVVMKHNIEILYDFKQHGVRESGILIHVTKPPDHGSLDTYLGRRRQSTVFTYLDLLGNKVKYIHNGQEDEVDFISLEIEFFGPDDLPPILQEKHAFVLPVNITARNDPPHINIANNGVLRLIENTKIRISSEVMSADDPDTPPSELRFVVTYHTNKGYFEKVGQTGTPVWDFTQQEVNERLIWFLHLGTGDSIIRLQVSDGVSSSQPAELRVETVQLHLRVVNNTGLVMPHGSAQIISSHNLTTQSNVPTQELEVRYEIKRPPSYGLIERQQYTSSEWNEVTTFAQRHIDSGHIRYRQYNPSATHDSDEFEFLVKAKSFTTPAYSFRIQYEPVFVSVKTNNKLQLVHQYHEKITVDNLEAVTNSHQIDKDSIRFLMLRAPSFGDLYKLDPGNRGYIDFSQLRPLRKESIFTQEDISNGAIVYKLKRDLYDKVQDFTDLQVDAPGAQGRMERFWIEFIPMKSDIRFINNGLYDVFEGDQKALHKQDLYIQTDEYREFRYTVLQFPQHGELVLEDPRSSAVIRSNVSDFTNTDITDSSLVYKHDDTENDKDSFTFLAVPVKSRIGHSLSEIPEFTGTFDIHVQMRNDNPPIRLVDKVFHVVTNGEKLITTDDLAFTDPDVDYNPSDLQYTRRGIPNGDIVNATDGTSVYQFSQRDLENRMILFKHRGELQSRAVIYVTDGQFYATSLFEIEAGGPYIKISSNTGATVKNNGEVAISTQNLSIEANVNADEIEFKLIQEPKWGYLRIAGRKVLNFVYTQLEKGKLYYQHAGGNSMEDHFTFIVVSGSTHVQGDFYIQIFMESAEQPPRVINNKILEVFGDELGTVNQSHLLVTHPDSSPENIEYLVLVLPKQGGLYRSDDLLTMEDMTFNQKQINDGYIGYQVSNTSATSDLFIFEVSNGFETLQGLEFLIEIIPSVVPLEVKNLTVKEGGRKALTPNHLRLKGRYFEGRLAQFEIVTRPSHGILESVNNRGNALTTFTSEDLIQGRIYYSHDDSEELFDMFTVRAGLVGQGKESEVQDIYVVVQGINDQGPRVVVNQGLTVWKGSMTQLNQEVLRADDPDTPSDQVLYRVSSPTNGHLTLLSNTFKQIANFTQQMIKDGSVVFVHTGDEEGSFPFQVTDGYHSDELRSFKITARPLILSLDTNIPLNAYPNLVQPITEEHLAASTNDPHQSKPIIYTLTSKPTFGEVITIANRKALEVISFTQEEIINKHIFYKHKGFLSGWTQNDSFTFRVNTLYAEPLEEETFHIFVSYANLNAENKNQLIKITGIGVEEGSEMVIGREHLDVTEFVNNHQRHGKRVSVTYSLKDTPNHGSLIFGGSPAVKKVRFTQRDINQHQLRYRHDDSDTLTDNFNLTLHVRIDNPSVADNEEDKEAQFPLTFNITIQPVNDQKFRLLTHHPEIAVVQGLSSLINNSVLKTVDADTGPAYLTYTVSQGPKHGVLMSTDGRTINRFSQEDIDLGRILYKHNGGRHLSDSFHFEVTDGAFPPYHKLFRVRVIKISLGLVNTSAVLLKQSESSVYITQQNMNITTNGNRGNVTYIIREPPRFGYIYVREYNVTRFSQTDVDNRRVLYLQTDMSSGYDYFVCDIVYSNTDIIYRNRRFNIKVDPLVKMGPLEAPIGSRVAITILSLDASRLSEVTGDIPVYRVINGPYFGRIVKETIVKRQIYRRQRYHNSEASTSNWATEFSHKDVVYTQVYYEGEARYNHQEGTKDNFTFQLIAYNVQPAEGVFFIGLAPSDDIPMIPVSPSTPRPRKPEPTVSISVTSAPDLPETSERLPNSDEIIHPSNVKNDHVLVLAILIPLLLLIIIIILVIFFIWRHRRKRDYTPTAKKSPRMRPTISGPLQIEQPHVHIEPQVERSPISEDSSKSTVEYQNTQEAWNYPDGSRATSEEADVVTPMIRHDLPSAPRSPDISRTEVSYAVPNCKVTPLIQNREEEEDDDDTSPEASRHSTTSDMFDWITSDPELLQHCRKTPPVLRKNQYWV